MAHTRTTTEFDPEEAFDRVAPITHDDIRANPDELHIENKDKHGKHGFTGQYGVFIDVRNESLELERF